LLIIRASTGVADWATGCLRVDRLGLVKRAAAGYGAGKNEERKANCTDFSCYLQGALQVTGWRAVRVIMSNSYCNYVIA
jgi:hypothetical protein